MQIDWLSLIIAAIIGFTLGIPSGILGNLAFHRIQEARKRKEEYSTTDTSQDATEFHGRLLRNSKMITNITDIMAAISKDIAERAKKAEHQRKKIPKYRRMRL